MGTEEICLGCMAEKGEAKVCPTCGYEEGTPPVSPLHLKPGTVLNRKYLIGRALGHGGFGITYLGLDLNLRVKLAIKEYFPTGLVTRDATAETVSVFSGDSRESFDYGLEKFLEEGRTLARFSNVPEIVGVRDFLRENGTAYLVMDYIEGITLKEYLARQGGKLPLDAALTFLMPVVHALEKVHASGMLHRDVSPDNIFVTSDFHVKLLDFGAARCAVGGQSRSLSVMLKPGYSPEEQYRSRGKQGPWTDVYAAAATLYKLLTGETPPEAMDRLAEDDLKPFSSFGLSLPESYEKAILKALSVRAEGRYQTMSEFEAALTGEVEQEDAPAKTEPPAEKSPLQSRTEPLGVAVPVLKNTPPVNGAEPAADVTVPLPKDREPGGDSAENKPVLFMHHLEDEEDPREEAGSSFPRKRKGLLLFAAALAVFVILAIASAAIGHQQPASVPAQAESSSEAQQSSSEVQSAESENQAVSSGTPASSAASASDSFAPDYAPGQENTVGNTSGNIVNNGIIAQQGNWFYYFNEEKLYKVKTDGSGKAQIDNDVGNVNSLNVSGDWIYYSSYGYGTPWVYKIKTDGTGKTSLCNDDAEYATVAGDWIYYCNHTDGDTIYKIKTDGTGRVKLCGDSADNMSVLGNWLYYCNTGDGNNVYKIGTDGSGRVKINDDDSCFVNVEGKWIYYKNNREFGQLFKIGIDGSGRTQVTDSEAGTIKPYYFNVNGSWIYYGYIENETCNLYKIKTDGTGKMKLCDGQSDNISIVGDWIYYRDSVENKLHRLKTDGTQLQLVN